MFEQNKYARWYYSIIDRARTYQSFHGYTERHHIKPKSLGGSNEKENIVRLSAREHYICHWLLTKFISGSYRFKMVCAFHRMQNMKNAKYRNSRAFQANKEQLSKLMSDFQKSRVKSKEHQERISKSLTGKKRDAVARKNIADGKTGVRLSPNHRAAIAKGLSRTYILQKPDGTLLSVSSLKQLCEEHDLSYKTLARTEKTKKPVRPHGLSLSTNTVGWMIVSSSKCHI